jgi:cyclic pyranopterin phosphate synthase
MGLIEMDIIHVDVNLGKVCNNRCRFCMTTDIERPIFVPKHEVLEEIEKLARMGFVSLGFLGGEPTIYPGITEIIRHAREVGFMEVHIVSNGRRYSDKNFLKSILESGATRFSVSIHCHIPEIEDYLTQVKGGFEQKIKGLANLMEFKRQGRIRDNIALNIVLTSKNYEQLPKTLAFFRSMGFTEFRLNFMRPEGRSLKNIDDLFVSYTQFQPILSEIVMMRIALGLGISLEGIPFCVARHSRAEHFVGEIHDQSKMIVSFNDVDPCGKITKETFLWNKRRSESKVKPDSCRVCKHFDICEGIYKEYAKKAGFGELEPVRD